MNDTRAMMDVSQQLATSFKSPQQTQLSNPLEDKRQQLIPLQFKQVNELKEQLFKLNGTNTQETSNLCLQVLLEQQKLQDLIVNAVNVPMESLVRDVFAEFERLQHQMTSSQFFNTSPVASTSQMPKMLTDEERHVYNTRLNVRRMMREIQEHDAVIQRLYKQRLEMARKPGPARCQSPGRQPNFAKLSEYLRAHQIACEYQAKQKDELRRYQPIQLKVITDLGEFVRDQENLHSDRLAVARSAVAVLKELRALTEVFGPVKMEQKTAEVAAVTVKVASAARDSEIVREKVEESKGIAKSVLKKYEAEQQRGSLHLEMYLKAISLEEKFQRDAQACDYYDFVVKWNEIQKKREKTVFFVIE